MSFHHLPVPPYEPGRGLIGRLKEREEHPIWVVRLPYRLGREGEFTRPAIEAGGRRKRRRLGVALRRGIDAAVASSRPQCITPRREVLTIGRNAGSANEHATIVSKVSDDCKKDSGEGETRC